MHSRPHGVRTPDLRAAVSGHMPVMDGWRGLAILIVVFHNAGAILFGSSITAVALTTLLRSGWVGVQLFFVLSGFLISGILIDSLGSTGYFRNFYIRRTLRIFPLYYLFLIVVLLIVPAVTDPSPEWLAAIRAKGIWYWLYLANWQPLIEGMDINGLQHIWSLAVEEQFYLVWPGLVLLAGKRFRLAALAVVIGSPIARILIYASDLNPEYLYYFTITRADAFAVGALMAIAARDPQLLAVTWPRRGWVLLASSVGLVVVVLGSRGFDQYAPGVLLAGQSLISFWFAPLMLGSLAPTHGAERALSRLLGAEWLRGFGKYSYAIYVFHFPLVTLTRGRAEELIASSTPAAQILVTIAYALSILAACTGLAYASWHLYEKHFLRLKDRLAPRGPSPTVWGAGNDPNRQPLD